MSEEVAEELPTALRGALAADGEALLKELQLPGSHHRAHHHQLRACTPALLPNDARGIQHLELMLRDGERDDRLALVGLVAWS